MTDILGISGKTGVAALIGDPIEHVRSPLMGNAAIHRRGLDLVMVPWQVRQVELAATLNALRAWQNLRGAIITMPHKRSVVPLLDEVTPEVVQSEACNVIRRSSDGRLMGTMLDGEAFVAGLLANGHEVDGTEVLLVGAGGAASAIAFAVAKHGARHLTIANRTLEKAESLAVRVQKTYPACECVAGDSESRRFDLAINATSLGMRPTDALPIPASAFRPGVVVADVVVIPDRTRLIETAERMGCSTHIGRHMIAAQIDWLIDFMLA